MAPPDVAATPPPPPAIGTDADSHAVTMGSGLSVDFSPDADELSPDSAAAVRSFALAAPQSDGTSFNVLAFAHGDAQDASSARRLSLARALAIRSVLMAAGVPSTRIYIRALGSDAGSGPADRADISVMGLNAPTATAATTPPAKPSPAGEKPE